MKNRKARRIVRLVIVLLLAVGAYLGYRNREYIQQLPIGTGSKAKILCSSVFLSGRDPAAIEAEDLGFHPLFKMFKAKVNWNEKSVTCSLLGTGLFRAKAVYLEGYGAVLLSGRKETSVRSRPRPAAGIADASDPEAVDWPMGDRTILVPADASIDVAGIRAATDRLFVESSTEKPLRTRALIVLHDGRLVVEKYGAGITKDTRLLSWSMAKSFTNALVGILAGQGKLKPGEPAPVPEWRAADDPRRGLTLDQLLRMSSGLEWVEAYADRPVSDVNLMLFRKADMAAFAAAKPLSVRPDAVWNYSSGTTNLVQRIIREACGSAEEYWNFPRRALFDKIGMRSAVWETDASGTFVGSSYLYATARDFARFGMLCQNDGVWQGERILPEGWMAYSTTPTPPAEGGQYGAFFWLNRGKPADSEARPYPKLPSDLFMALGYQGQAIAVLPSRKLVVVRLGMTYDDNWGMENFLAEVIRAVKL
jgi:CubicO group peptidase (beta-lactamase class C family)